MGSGTLTGIAAAAPAIALIAFGLLIARAIVLLRRGGERQKPILMIVLAVVLLGNVLIVTL